jgi:hypothetical protein
VTLKTEARADFLKTAIAEDRQEIRLLKDRIYQLTGTITVSSFAVTAFILAAREWPHRRPFLLFADCGFLALVWAAFLPLKRDLDAARLYLEFRQDMIPELGKDETGPFQPFGKVPAGRKVHLEENGTYWFVSLATAVLVLKAMVVFWSAQ